MSPTIIITILVIAIEVTILGIFTGTKVFIPKISSGLIRLAVGGLNAGGAYAIWISCVQEYGRMCHYELALGPFFAFFLLAISLIPVGIIQIFIYIAKN
jgi:hypothetical protein